MVSKTINRKNGKLVLPGECLGVIEEFIPNAWTYVDNGEIFASVTGRALIDFLNKRVSVYPAVNKVKIPKIGSEIMGTVKSTSKETANVKIFKVEDKLFFGSFSGVLHISNVATYYIESMADAFSPMDVLRANVVSEKNKAFHLSTEDRNLGVVYAFCSSCGGYLMLHKQTLKCSKCSKIEKRKIALDYGKATF